MILVTVGTHNHGFDRLVRAMDELAAELDESVLIQRGSSACEPCHAEHFQWISMERMRQLTCDARVVVTHAAAGSVLTALLQGKALVVVPRLPEYGECIDDHQRQLASALDAQSRAVAVEQPSKDALRIAVERAARRHVAHDGPARLVAALRRQLDAWEPFSSAARQPIGKSR